MTTFLVRAFVLLLLVQPAQAAPLSGTKSIGPTGDYPSLTAAIADIQTQTLGGALLLELQSTYVSTVETFPLTFTNLGTTVTNTLTLRPQAGATGLSISSADTTAATVDLNGAQFVVIDGRPGGTGTVKQLTIANTSTAGVALRFINEASNNTIQHTTLQGVNTSATSGVVFFSTTTGANGNDNNILDHCDIRDGANTPTNGLYALGTTGTTAQNNSGNTVSNCNIFNFYRSTATDVAGVRLNGGNTDWIIANNSFYQTFTRTAVAAFVRPIYVNNSSGNNFTVTGNFIGSSAPNLSGAPWTTTGTTAAYRFVGIALNVGTVTPSSVQGNVVRNIVWTSSSNATDLPGAWCGIQLNAGSANIGTVTGNSIGSATGTGAISITTSGSGGTTFGIGYTGTGTVVINNNTIGSISVNGSSASVSASFTGIQTWSGTNTISGNLIGSASTLNSINSATSSTSTTGQQVVGINIPGNVFPVPISTLSGNTIANLNNNYVGSAAAGRICGIVTSGGSSNIVANTIRNLTTTSQNGNDTTSHAVCGIAQTSTELGQNVSQNMVHSLAVTAGSAAVAVTGIYYSGAGNGTNIVARNLVHSLSIPSTRTGSRLRGMFFGAGLVTVQNNMIRVGLDASGLSTAETSNVRGISDNGSATSGFFCHNSVYVGGASSSGANGSSAFGSAANSGPRLYKNNIFFNARGNVGGTGKHYAVIYQAPATIPNGLSAGGNIILANGTGGVFGWYDGADITTLTQWQTVTGQDATSAVADPLFVNPNGDATTVNLHLQPSNPAEGGGLAIAGITDDFDGHTRTGAFADIGADAGDFTLSNDVLPPSISYPLLTSGSTNNRVFSGWASIVDNVGVASGVNTPRLYFKKSTDADAFGVANDSTGNGWKYVVASGSGPYSFTLDYALINGGSVTIGDTIQYFVVAQDAANNLGSSPAAVTASANPPVQNVNGHGAVNSFSILPSVSGTVTVGSGATYPSLSGASGLFAALNGAVLTSNLVVNITSDLTETGGVTLSQLRTDEYPPTRTLTIQPGSATMRTISGSVNAGLITLNGADCVTVDGRFEGTGRYLTFRNANTGTSATTILFVNDASSNTMRSCIVEGATTAGFPLGVISFTTGAVTGNDNNLVTDNQVRDLSSAAGVPSVLLSSNGSSAAVANSNNVVSNNELFNFNSYGVFINGGGNESWTISGNNIHEVNASNGNIIVLTGIRLGGGGSNSVTDNHIHDLVTTGSQSKGIHSVSTGTTTISHNRITALSLNSATALVFGIHAEGVGSPTLQITNNQIALKPATTMSSALYGIYVYDTTGSVVNAFHNTIFIGGTESGANNSWASLRQGNSMHMARNNIYFNNRSGGSGSHFAAGSVTTGGSYSASNNVYAGTGATVGSFMDLRTNGTPMPVAFATWQTSTDDADSQAGIAGSGNFTAAMFVDATNGDLHLVPGGNSLVNGKGTPIAGVTDDFDGDLRSLTAPTIGADEAVPLSGIAGWRQIFFGTSTNSGNATDIFDYDHDGLPNLIEWACNLNPTTASTLPATVSNNGANVEFIYTRSVTALNAGTTFSVEWSDTLTDDWQNTNITEAILSDDGTVQQIKATLPAGNAGRRFVHLKVTAPPE